MCGAELTWQSSLGDDLEDQLLQGFTVAQLLPWASHSKLVSQSQKVSLIGHHKTNHIWLITAERGVGEGEQKQSVVFKWSLFVFWQIAPNGMMEHKHVHSQNQPFVTSKTFSIGHGKKYISEQRVNKFILKLYPCTVTQPNPLQENVHIYIWRVQWLVIDRYKVYNSIIHLSLYLSTVDLQTGSDSNHQLSVSLPWYAAN